MVGAHPFTSKISGSPHLLLVLVIKGGSLSHGIWYFWYIFFLFSFRLEYVKLIHIGIGTIFALEDIAEATFARDVLSELRRGVCLPRLSNQTLILFHPMWPGEQASNSRQSWCFIVIREEHLAQHVVILSSRLIAH